MSRLKNTKVKIEPPLKKKEIVQCKRCQRYGHTQKYCNRQYKCVKCAGTHPTVEYKKSVETPPTRHLCSGHHTANYKGCPCYKELLEKTFPKPRLRKNPNIQSNLRTNPMGDNQCFTDPSFPYEQAATGSNHSPNVPSQTKINEAYVLLFGLPTV